MGSIAWKKCSRMNSVTIKRFDGMYIPISTTNEALYVITEWFRSDVVKNFDSWREWLRSIGEDKREAESNATWLEKHGDQLTLTAITDILTYEYQGNPIPEGYRIHMSIENAIELINSWEELLKTKPEQIMIYEENGIYRMKEA
jgi:hypothetical protein